MIINDLDDYYIVFDTKNRNIELDTLISNAINHTTKQPYNTNAFLFIILFLNITTKSQNHNIKH